eukprot:TRINITY_DN3048_c0_g1_i13.p1 TRINITY_DN3048_c0_g1~~TRINITY_DN3048_c0_g1_i13.p1  ORF type:complete len:372 (-),score=53.80 TRINITY_DN3048_c0_g1_i13:880-1995(-)
MFAHKARSMFPSLLKTRRRRLQTVLLCVTLGVVFILSVALIITSGGKSGTRRNDGMGDKPTGEEGVKGDLNGEGHVIGNVGGNDDAGGHQDDVYSVKVENMVGYDPKEEDPELKTKRDMIKKAFIHAYGGYESKCMGEGEVRPHAGHCTNWLVQHMGLTIIDSLDTMLIMGLTEQYKRGRDYLANNLDWGKLGNVQVFELNIRCLGGLLSAYYMTKDPVLYRLSVSLGELLLPVFDSPTGYPYPWFNFKTKKKTLSSWTGNSLILAHLGTLQLEFAYLSYLTGNITYIEKVWWWWCEGGRFLTYPGTPYFQKTILVQTSWSSLSTTCRYLHWEMENRQNNHHPTCQPWRATQSLQILLVLVPMPTAFMSML